MGVLITEKQPVKEPARALKVFIMYEAGLASKAFNWLISPACFTETQKKNNFRPIQRNIV